MLKVNDLILNTPSLPGEMSISMLANSTLPGYEYARMAVKTERTTVRLSLMKRAVIDYAKGSGLDVERTVKSYAKAQLETMMVTL